MIIFFDVKYDIRSYFFIDKKCYCPWPSSQEDQSGKLGLPEFKKLWTDIRLFKVGKINNGMNV